jgi:ribose-phosphate pyrophosphokinase
MNVIGEVEGRNCVIMDDMVDTAGTLTKAAEVLKSRGAKKVIAYCTHPVLSGDAKERIMDSQIDKIFTSDSIYHNSLPSKFKVTFIDELISHFL